MTYRKPGIPFVIGTIGVLIFVIGWSLWSLAVWLSKAMGWVG